LQQLLDAMHGLPAFVQNGRLDILAANPLARALYADLFDDPGTPVPRELGRFPSGDIVVPAFSK